VTYLCMMTSSDFDSYLGIASPSGDTVEDDDSGGDGDSLILYLAEETGTYRLTATSFKPGQVGSYQILVSRLDVDEEITGETAADGFESDPVVIEGALILEQSATGRVEDGDEVLNNGEYQDTWLFAATTGQAYVFEVESSEFDTYLILVDTEGNILQNDDLDNARDKSGIAWTAPSNGLVSVIVTSYRRGETGSYELRVRRGSASVADAAMLGKVYGVFVGISDYPGVDQDLPLCDSDAVRLRRVLVDHAGMALDDSILLVNREASLDRVRAAIREVGSRVQDGDTFVFFYSGHGERVKRPQLVERDPDGHDALDEALVLHDGLLLDDELDTLLMAVRHGTCLIILDSCFSGGFSKDVISRPGRMGLFSSPEDVTSATAAKFKAGGFLAAFAADAIGKDRAIADENGDGRLSASELSQFIYESYRNQLVRAKSSDYLDVLDNLGFQQLVVDRGGVAVTQPLFNLR